MISDETSFSMAMIAHIKVLFGALLFIMQLGFCMLEAGSVRKKNISSILVKNLQNCGIAAISFFIVGFSFASGPGPDGAKSLFLGSSGSALIGAPDSMEGTWFIQYAFAQASSSIVSGAVAERMTVEAYLVFAAVMTGFIFPVISCWIWNVKGWLHFGNDNSTLNGIIDCAGCGVVHLSGGIAALVGCYILGPRVGKFRDVRNIQNDRNEVEVIEFSMNSPSLRVIGVFMLWFGWYSFNASSAFSYTGGDSSLNVPHSCLTTTMSAAACGLTSLFVCRWRNKGHKGEQFDLDYTINGILGGLVSITAGCTVVESWAAVVIGFIGAFVWMGCKYIVLQYKIDDVVDAVAIHAGCGVWGLLAAALFASESLTIEAYGVENVSGIFYGGNGKLLGACLLGCICIIAFTFCATYPLFILLDSMDWLRISKSDEVSDLLDFRSHGLIDTNTSEGAAFHGRPLDPSVVQQWANKQERNDSIDKTTFLALAYSKDVDDLVGTLALFDKVSGGNLHVSGPQFNLLIDELRAVFRPTISTSSSNILSAFNLGKVKKSEGDNGNGSSVSSLTTNLDKSTNNKKYHIIAGVDSDNVF